MKNNDDFSTLNLAKERTKLAGVRTSLSFVRTMLVCLSVAFAFMKIDKNKPIDTFTIILFIVSGICFVLAILSYFFVIKHINNDK